MDEEKEELTYWDQSPAYHGLETYLDDQDHYDQPGDLDHWSWELVSKGFRALPDLHRNRDWNAEYQQILDLPVSSRMEHIQRSEALDQLVLDFMLFAAHTSDVLVREKSLDASLQTVKPLTTFGIAGGAKYLHGNCFFKFARDKEFINSGRTLRLYGSDSAAAKSASNELRAMNAILGCGKMLRGLHVPLSAVFYVRGHCLIASARVPIDCPESLVYGSHDLGRTVKDSSAAVRSMVENLANNLNLRKHRVYSVFAKKHVAELFTPGDLEIHQSKIDGRFYALDCARLLPPVPCAFGSRDYMYKQFRPEFLTKYCGKIPLNPDSYTKWSLGSEDEDSLLINTAFRILMDEVIPKFVKVIDFSEFRPQKRRQQEITASESLGTHSESSLDLSFGSRWASEFHSAGINMRYLQFVRQKCTSPIIRRELLFEMISRTCKSRLRSCLRSISCVTETSYLIIMSRYLIDILGISKRSDDFWKVTLIKDLYQKFQLSISDPDNEDLHFIRDGLQSNESGCCERFLKHLSIGTKKEVPDKWVSEILSIILSGSLSHDTVLPHIFLQVKVKQCARPPFLISDSAEEEILQEISLREDALGRNSFKLLDSFFALLDVYMLSGSSSEETALKKAERIIKRIIDIVSVSFSDPVAALKVAQSYLQIGKLYYHFGRISHCSESVNTAIDIYDSILKEEALDQASKDIQEASLRGRLNCLRTKASIQVLISTVPVAEMTLKTALEDCIARFGEDDIDLAGIYEDLGLLRDSMDDFDKSFSFFNKAYSIKKRLLGENPSTAISLGHLAGSYRNLQRIYPKEDWGYGDMDVEKMYLQSLSIVSSSFAAMNYQNAIFFNGLAGFYVSQERFDEAHLLYEEILKVRIKCHGSNHPKVAWTLASIAFACQKQPSRFHEAGKFYRQSLKILSHEEMFPNLGNLAWTMVSLAKWLYECSLEEILLIEKQQMLKESISLLEEALVIEKKLFETSCPRIASTGLLLAKVKRELGADPIEYVLIVLDALKAFREFYGINSVQYRECLQFQSKLGIEEEKH